MPTIEIKKTGKHTAILISFDITSEKFDSNYERNKFFRGLYGWNQTIKKQSSDKVYTYHREGILNEMPYIKVDNSVFIVAMQEMQKILDYMEEWHDKVVWKTFRVMLDDEQFQKLKEEDEESAE